MYFHGESQTFCKLMRSLNVTARTMAGLAVILLVAACSKSPAPGPNAASVAETPAPAAPVVAATEPVATPKHLAEPGIFYVIQAVSITTSDGITRIPTGTRVSQLEDLGAKLRVTDGKTEFEAGKEQVTNDLDVVAGVMHMVTRQASATSAWTQAQWQAANAMDRQKQDSAAASAQTDSKAKTTQQLQTRRGVLVQEEARLNALIQQSYNDESQERYDHVIRGRITSKSGLVTRRPALQSELAAVKQELSEINQQLANNR